MNKTIFDQILSKEIPSWVIWQDDNHLAFLTPFPSTPGVTVVIPKINIGDYLFDLEDQQVTELILASKKVAKLLERSLNVKRVAMIFEGTGVAHVHSKLYPLHGILSEQTNVQVSSKEFHDEYLGYLSTIEGPRMSDDELNKLQRGILDHDIN
jgi:histidine triad (HIT) family protein